MLFPTPLGRSSLSQSLLLPWQPLSNPRRGLGWFGSAVPPWDVSWAAAGQWMRSKGQRGGLGARYSPSLLAVLLGSLGEKKVKKVSLRSLHRGSGSERVPGMKTGGVGIGVTPRGGACAARDARQGNPRLPRGAIPSPSPRSVEDQHTWEKKSQERRPGRCSPHGARLEFCSSPEDAMGQTHTSKHHPAPLP